MNRKGRPAPIEGVLAKSIDFEITIADIARKSERRAWYVAIGSLLMSLILAGGYFFFLPLKEKVPYLVMADAYWRSKTDDLPASTPSSASVPRPTCNSWPT